MANFNYKKWITENKYGKINEQINPIGNPPNSASFCPSGTDFNAQLCNGGFPTGANWGASASDEWIQGCCTGSLDPNPGDAPTTPTGQVMAMQPTGNMKKSKKRSMKRRPTRGLEEQPSLMKRRAQMAKRRMPTAKTPQGSPKMSKGLREIKEFIKKQVKKLNEQGIAPVGPIAQGAIAKAVYAYGCDSTVQGLNPGVDYLPDVPGIQGNETFGIFIGNLTVNGQTPKVGQVIYKPIGSGVLNYDSVYQSNMGGDLQWGTNQNGGISKWRIKSVGPATDSSVEDVFNVSCYHPLNSDGSIGNMEVGYNCAPLNPNSVDGCLAVPKYLGGGNPNMPNPDAVYNTLEDCIAAGCSSEGLDPCMSDNWVNLTQDQQDLFCSTCDSPNASLAWHCACCPGDGPIPIKSKGKAPMGKAPMGKKPMMENKKRNYKAFKKHINKKFGR